MKSHRNEFLKAKDIYLDFIWGLNEFLEHYFNISLIILRFFCIFITNRGISAILGLQR